MYSRYVATIKSQEKRFDPRKIRCYLRLQSDIDHLMDEARTILAEEKGMSAADMAEIGIAFLESSDFVSVEKYASQALQLEEAKPENIRDRETIATIHYLLATVKKESHAYEEALDEYMQSYNIAESNWLKTNITENMGMIFMHHGNSRKAEMIFEKFIQFASSPEARAPIKNALPAIQSCYGLAMIKDRIEAGVCPGQGFMILEEVTQLYQKMFLEKGLSEDEQSNSHDWQSHQFHLGVAACMDAERHSRRTSDENNLLFKKAEKYLQHALKGRIANYANDNRLGEVYFWLGRVALGMKSYAAAINNTEQAIVHYKHMLSPRRSEETSLDMLKSRALIKTIKFESDKRYAVSITGGVVEAISEKPKIPIFLQFLSSCCPCTKKKNMKSIHKPSMKMN